MEWVVLYPITWAKAVGLIVVCNQLRTIWSFFSIQDSLDWGQFLNQPLWYHWGRCYAIYHACYVRPIKNGGKLAWRLIGSISWDWTPLNSNCMIHLMDGAFSMKWDFLCQFLPRIVSESRASIWQTIIQASLCASWIIPLGLEVNIRVNPPMVLRGLNKILVFSCLKWCKALTLDGDLEL